MKTVAASAAYILVVLVGVMGVQAHVFPSLSSMMHTTKESTTLAATTTDADQNGVASTSTPSSATSEPVSKPESKPTTKPTPQPASTSGIEGTVTIGPTCPVQKYPPDAACADKPYATTLVIASTVVGRNGGVLVQTNAQGHFSKAVPAGTYTIRSTSSGMLPRLSPMTVEVRDGAMTKVQVQFDSGIR
jgi:cytoskeletal protein RodZ